MTAKSRSADPVLVQRRTLGVLSGGVALSGLGVTVGITVGGLLARDVAGTETAAGLGQTAGVLGAADVLDELAQFLAQSSKNLILVLNRLCMSY